MKKIISVVCCTAIIACAVAQTKSSDKPVYKDAKAPIDQRISDLLKE